MISISKSETADSRTCDFSKVTKAQLLSSSYQHIDDVTRGLEFFSNMLLSINHDPDKISDINTFYEDFKTDFAQHTWWDNHRKVNRHHLSKADGIPADVNLVDVLEYIVDCVMAGKARTGTVYDIKLDSAVLQAAFANTTKMFTDEVEVRA